MMQCFVSEIQDCLTNSRAVARKTAGTLYLACRLWTVERHVQVGELRRHGSPVLEWRPLEPLEVALAGARCRRPRLATAG